MSQILDTPACWALRLEFELEPLLKQYLETYPDGDMKKYEIVFKSQDSDTGDSLYLLLHFYNQDRVPRVTSFEKFLDAYCKLNNKVGSIARTGIPRPIDRHHGGGKIVGNLDGRRNTEK